MPGIWTAEQITQWKEIVEAVHRKGSFIYCQLWALGRAAVAKVLEEEFGLGEGVVSSSATAMKEGGAVPRELSEDEIGGFVEDYVSAARNAVEGAGFDGVEIHAANGYLIDQFTQDTCNHRTDGWGGSVEKRSRFGLEIARRVVEAVGKERVGIRLSPWSTFQGMKMADPVPQFTHLVSGLRELGLAYLHLVESRISGNADVEETTKVDFAMEAWGSTSPVLLAGGFKPDSAKRAVEIEYKDKEVAIVFGRYFISTPDLPFRILNGLELTAYNRETFYKTGSPDGYIDYPFSKEFEAAGASKL